MSLGSLDGGTDGTGITQPTGGTAVRGWLSGIYSKLSGALAVTGTFWQATQPVSAASLPLPTGAAQDGTDGTGITQPTGGVGIRGWLSGIYSGVIGAIPAGTAIIGQVGIDQTTPGTTNAVVSTPSATITPAGTNSIAADLAIDANIPATVGQYGYLSGVIISGLGATAGSVIAVNIQGLQLGQINFYYSVPAGVTVEAPFRQITFAPALRSSAIDTLVQINLPAFGAGNTEQTVTAYGYTSTSAQPLL